jgi:radical SAM protein with 4Fe4S-binding SPASM domain
MDTGLAVFILDRVKRFGVLNVLGKAAKYLARHGLRGLPSLTQVQVEVTTACNLRCPDCFKYATPQDPGRHNRNMTVEEFRLIVESLPRTNTLLPQGIGEPTVHPDLPEMVRIASATGKFNDIQMNSNGLAKPPDYYAELFEKGLTGLQISVDTLDQALADRIRTGTDVGRLRECVGLLVKRFPGRVGVRTVVRAENAESIPEMLAELNSFGAMAVYLQIYVDLGSAAGVVSDTRRDRFIKNIRQLEARLSRLRVTTLGITPSDGVCASPWTSPAITVDGYVTPCCVIWEKERMNFGNVLETPFSEVWASPVAQEFRREIRSHSPEACADCPYYVFRKAS